MSHVWHCEYEDGFRQEVTGTVVLGKQLDPEHKEDEGVDCGLPQERPYPSPLYIHNRAVERVHTIKDLSLHRSNTVTCYKLYKYKSEACMAL